MSDLIDQELKQIFTPDSAGKAGYKLQVNFGPNRSMQKDFTAALTFWSSGKFFHGGGDDQLYLCLNRLKLQELKADDSHLFYLDVIQKKVDGHGCGLLIPSESINHGAAYCDNCKRMIVAENLVNVFYFKGMVEELSVLTAEIFRRTLDSNADIYCKYDPTDIRYTAMQKTKGSEEAHRLRGLLIYPLGRILKDISTGATLEGRFKALYSA
jgi:hypothetical protein